MHLFLVVLRICAWRWVFDFFNEAGHVLQEQVVHIFLVHLPQLHDAPIGSRCRCCHLLEQLGVGLLDYFWIRQCLPFLYQRFSKPLYDLSGLMTRGRRPKVARPDARALYYCKVKLSHSVGAAKLHKCFCYNSLFHTRK